MVGRVNRIIDRSKLPRAGTGQVVGLLGGSFDPPHLGHVNISRHALKRFGLDTVWWLVTPGNPLKSRGPAALDRRLLAARTLVKHPRIKVTDLEATLNTRFTADTLAELQRLFPNVRFVWLMGADNLASFHRWDNWRWIMRNIPIGVMARPGDRIGARMSKAAVTFREARLRGRDSMVLARSLPPCWCYINVPMLDISSTEIRDRGDWPR